MEDPDHSLGQSLADAAKDAIAQGCYDAALCTCAELRAQFPKSPHGYGLAAVALRRKGDRDGSNAMVFEAIKVIGLRARNLITLGDTAMDFQEWDEAVLRWKDLRIAFPGTRQGYRRGAAAHQKLGQLTEAEALLEELVTEFTPKAADFHIWANLAFERNDWEEAARRLTLLKERFPKEPLAYLNGARAMSELRREETKLHHNKRAGETHSMKEEFDSLYREMREGRFELQDLIDAARWIVRAGSGNSQTIGAQRLFNLAETDETLAKVLAGETVVPPSHDGKRAIKPMFFFPTVTQTDNLEPLLERLADDPRFEPIVLCSRNRSRANADSFEHFSKVYSKHPGITVVDGGAHIDRNVSPYELSPDVVFFHTPYTHGPNHPFFLRADFVARHTRVAHVNYGYFLLTLEGEASHIYDNTHVQSADMIFSESDISDAIFKATLGAERVFKTGYPKFDNFRKHLEKRPFEERVSGKERLDVIWTPHWQMKEDPTGGTHTSNFTRYVDTMLKLSEREDVRLHVRPHPLLRPRLRLLGHYEFTEYDVVMQRFEANGAIVYPPNEGVSYVEALMSADVLISDFSSLIPEFFITERPIIFCRTDDVWNNGKWIGPFGKKLISEGCYTVDDDAELVDRLSTIVAERKHPKMEAMQSLIAEHNLFPEGAACKRIADVIAQRVSGSEV